MLRFPCFHPQYSRTCLHMRTPTHARHIHSPCKIAMWRFFRKKKKWRENWSEDLDGKHHKQVCDMSSGCSKLKKKFDFCFFVLGGLFVLWFLCVCMYFPLAEIEVNAKGEWSSPSGRCSKVYPHSGRGRVGWSLAVGVLRMGGCQAIGWTHRMCASPACAPRHNQTACQCYMQSVSESEPSFLKLTCIACPGDSDWVGHLQDNTINNKANSKTILDHSAWKNAWTTSWAPWVLA